VETVEAFYEDERRRNSREVRFGVDWRSSKYALFQFGVFWVEDTQELCLLRSPIRDVQWDGPVSRFILQVPPHVNAQPLRDHEVTVEVIARLPDDEIAEVLDGWRDHLGEPDGIEWVRGRVKGKAVPGADQ
jgi:hypothetical protein